MLITMHATMPQLIETPTAIPDIKQKITMLFVAMFICSLQTIYYIC